MTQYLTVSLLRPVLVQLPGPEARNVWAWALEGECFDYVDNHTRMAFIASYLLTGDADRPPSNVTWTGPISRAEDGIVLSLLLANIASHQVCVDPSPRKQT